MTPYDESQNPKKSVKDISDELILHSFEAGRRAKPDELEGCIAHLIGSYFLMQDRAARFDIHVAGSYCPVQQKPKILLSGEVSASLLEQKSLQSSLESTLAQLVCNYYNKVHVSGRPVGEFLIECAFRPQAAPLALNQNAGDLGKPIAVAYKDGPNFLPWERFIAVELRNFFDGIYLSDGQLLVSLAKDVGPQGLPGLGADGKIGVDALYEGASFKKITSITLALQHADYVNFDTFCRRSTELVRYYLRSLEEKYGCSLGNPDILINGLGPWVVGGWEIDEGSRDAKPYRDAFATYGCCEDSFSGEDPSKPSATGTFLARYIAVQIVGNGLADFARVALTYNIGREDVGLNITTQGTGKVSQEELHAWVRENIPLGIKDAIEIFHLRDPELYRQIVDNSDFFQDPNLPWNKVGLKY